MPDIFERFCRFWQKVSDYYELEKLSPAYRVVFSENDYIDIEDTPEKSLKLSERIEPGSGKHLKKNSWMKLKKLPDCDAGFGV